MALAATTEVEVRTTGSDNNGGGFVTGGSGTDYSQQDSHQYFIDGATNTGVVQATTTDILIAGYTVSANDVNNLLQITGGTATAGFYQISSVNTGTNTYTLDRSAGTAAQTVVGRIGGGLATPGKAGSVPLVAGNKVWIKYHASNVYSTTSTTANVANGRLSISVGSFASPVLIRGYDTTHGDQTGNRPTIRWGANAASNYLVSLTATYNFLENVILDGNRGGGFTSTRCVSMSNNPSALNNVLIKSANNGGVVGSAATSPMILTGVEVTDCVTSSAINCSGALMILDGCYIHDNTGVNGLLNSGTNFLIINNCILDTNGTGIALSAAGRVTATNCTIYGQSSHGLDLQVTATIVDLYNCIFENNGTTSGYGINNTAAGVNGGLRMTNCAFYNNSSGKYETAKVLAAQTYGEIIPTGSVFTDGPNADFKPNNTASQGALIRAAGFPTTFPGGTTSFADVGAAQHQDSGGSTTNIFNVME